MIFAMFVWGIGYSIMEMIPKKPIGKIFGRKVTQNEFADMLGRWQRLFFSQAKDSIVSLVWKQLLFVEEAKRMGIVVTAQEVESALQGLAFQIFGGQINMPRAGLMQFLCNNFMLNTEQIDHTLREALLVEKLESMLRMSTKMTTEEIWQRYSLENEQVKFKALTLKAKDFLDIGSGYGDFSENVSQLGYSVIAADASPHRPYYLRPSPQIPYLHFDYGKVEVADPGCVRGRVAVLRHVMEHIKEPLNFLKKLAEYKAGYVYIVVPNFGRLERAIFKNYDMLLMSVVSVMVGTVALMADLLLRTRLGRNSDNDDNKLGAVFLILGLIFAILSPFVAQLIQLAISRRREFLADAGSVMLTRQPQGLISALKKISADHEPLEVANKATAHLYIANPFKDHARGGVGWFSGLFLTHPPVEARLVALNKMI